MAEFESKYHDIEQPDQLSNREKEDAMGAYLMMFGALAAGLPLPIINLLAAVIYYFVNAKKGRFIKFHSLQSLLSQLPTSIMNAGLLFWTLRKVFDNKMFESDTMDGFADAGDLYQG